VARADAVIAAMRMHEPAVLEAVERSLATAGGEAGDVQLGAKDFAAAPHISFDKAVLERHEAVAVTALDAIWRDVGTWAEVAELYPADGDGNRQSGRVRLSSSRNSFVLSPHRLTVGIGLEDLIVVDTPDALLIASRNELGLLREAVEAMAAASFPEVAAGDDTVSTKRFSIGVGETMFIEADPDSHRYWIVLHGQVVMTIGNKTSIYGVNENFRIPQDAILAGVNAGSETAQLIEVRILRRSTL
jgi:mannose-1-phosphate guanylyltransferase / mannose-6-phosphate isomerase